jgi:hypothetical protein
MATSHLDWLRSNQRSSGSGPIGKVITGTAAVPFIEGSMFRSDAAGNDADPEWTMFDAKMSVFRSNRGPPPAPLCQVRGCRFVDAYIRWYNTTGIALTKKWEAEHPVVKPKPKAAVAPAPAAAPAPPKKEGPSRIVLEVSEQSGW